MNSGVHIPREQRRLMERAANSRTGRASVNGMICQLIAQDEAGAGTFEFSFGAGSKHILSEINLNALRRPAD